MIDMQTYSLAVANAKSFANQTEANINAEKGVANGIATLDANGVLAAAQIPALSINDVFEVASTAAMLQLTAQRGDVALIIPDDVVTDSYILAADDPTTLSNWKKLGVSYVANAGHAVTADNADKINNHSIEVMTVTEYSVATIDAETFYFVVPD